uniref:ER membrane protein complex subunit 1 n=1 Tax=Eutreptiella gymnastica TaxID=73025 RepID=A0A7S1JAN4_9EUGL
MMLHHEGVRPRANILVILIVATLVVPSLGRGCNFTLDSAEVVAFAQLWPIFERGHGSVSVTVDQTNGGILLYPQMSVNAKYYNKYTNETIVAGQENEVFVYFDKDGAYRWSFTGAYSTAFPLMEGDVYLLREEELLRLSSADGTVVWRTKICQNFRRSLNKITGDAFFAKMDSVGISPTMVIGVALANIGRCDLQLGDNTNLTSLNSSGPNTPYMLFVDRQTGKLLRYESYAPVEIDILRHGLVSEQGLILAGMQLSAEDEEIVAAAKYKADRSLLWTVNIVTPSRHIGSLFGEKRQYPSLLWFQVYADFLNDHVLFISDPQAVAVSKNFSNGDPGPAEVGRMTDRSSPGVLFGGLNKHTGRIDWQQSIEYAGILISTLITYIDSNMVVIGGIWDGAAELRFGEATLAQITRPVQGMLGFLAFFDIAKQTYWYVQEVAPEVVYPGHDVGFFSLAEYLKPAMKEELGNMAKQGENDAVYQIVSAPAFWDESPRRRVDNLNWVSVPAEHDGDTIVLLRYSYQLCTDKLRTSQVDGAADVTYLLIALAVVSAIALLSTFFAFKHRKCCFSLKARFSRISQHETDSAPPDVQDQQEMAGATPDVGSQNTGREGGRIDITL